MSHNYESSLLATYVVVVLMATVGLIDFFHIVYQHNLDHVEDNLYHNLYCNPLDYILRHDHRVVAHRNHRDCHLVMSNQIRISYFSQMMVEMEVCHRQFDEQIFHRPVFEFFDLEFCDHVVNVYQFLSTEKINSKNLTKEISGIKLITMVH